MPVDCFLRGHIKNMAYQQKERHRNTETHSRNHCCRGKEIRISNSECVFVALNIQNSKRVRCFATCGMSDSTTFFHIIYIHIQGDSGGICITLGYDSMSDSKQKSSMNMGPILNGYGVMGIF